LPPSPVRLKKSDLANERAKIRALKADAAARKAAKAEKKREKAERKIAVEAAKAPPSFSLKAAIAEQVRAAHEAAHLVNAGDAVHQTRIALKRLRVLAAIADEALPEGGASLEFAAQAAMHRLAPARDLHAVENAARAVATTMKGPGAAFLVRAANEFALSRRAVETAALADTREALLRLNPIVDAAPEAGAEAALRAAKAFERRARKAFAKADGSRAVLKRHTWRKREKDSRYAALILGETWPGKRRRKLASAVTEALGRERDAGLLIARLGANARTPGVVLKQVKRYRRTLGKKADRIGAKLHKRA
jgi:hypothetical protein